MLIVRIAAFVLLAALTAGPLSRVTCLWTCDGAAAEAAAPGSCHEESQSGPTFGLSADHCDGPAVPASLVAIANSTGSMTPVPVNIETPISFTGEQFLPAVALNSIGFAGPPISSRLIPLRI